MTAPYDYEESALLSKELLEHMLCMSTKLVSISTNSCYRISQDSIDCNQRFCLFRTAWSVTKFPLISWRRWGKWLVTAVVAANRSAIHGWLSSNTSGTLEKQIIGIGCWFERERAFSKIDIIASFPRDYFLSPTSWNPLGTSATSWNLLYYPMEIMVSQNGMINIK